MEVADLKRWSVREVLLYENGITQCDFHHQEQVPQMALFDLWVIVFRMAFINSRPNSIYLNFIVEILHHLRNIAVYVPPSILGNVR